MARFLLRMTKFVLGKFTDEQCTPLPWYKEIIAMRQTLIIILTPSLFAIATWMSMEANCAYVILIMAVYWMTEALPMAVTALMPVVLCRGLTMPAPKHSLLH